jgi:hypothetical protein
LVAGPALPKGELKLGACRIREAGKQKRQDLVHMAQERLIDLDYLAAFFGHPDVFSAEMPLTALVHSKHELSVVVDAPDENSAYLEAEKEVTTFLDVLALAVGVQKYRFYASVANRIPEPGGVDTRNYMSTGISQATIYESMNLRAEDEEYARTLLGLAEQDKVFERAFGFLQSAWRLGNVPLVDSAIHKAVLSNCFLVVEAVSDAVTKGWRKENKKSTLSDQELIVDNLREQLNSIESASKAVAEVREAYKDLQRAERYFQDLKIDTAGSMLGVEKRFVELAKELSKLRNRHLGHAGSTGTKDLDDWIFKSDDSRLEGDPGHFGKGELTAMAYLNGYVAHINGM